jgi:hypothetical protein
MRNRFLIVLLAGGLVFAACADSGVVGSDNDEPVETTADDTSASANADSETSAEETEDPSDTDGHDPEAETSSLDEEDSGKTPEETEPADDDNMTPTTRPSKEPERVPEPTTSPPVTGETPADLLTQIIADAADRAGVADSAVTVIRDEFAIWNDGSLGCPEPGQVYTQALVEGYWVVLEAGGTEYDYRATTKGHFILCEGVGFQPQPPTG